MRPDIAFAGAGNVAFRFSLALQEKGYDISFVYSRTERSRDKLVRALRANGSDTQAAADYRDLASADLIFIAVSDDAIEQLAGMEKLPAVVHTSGATDISILKPLEDIGCRCGVVYPLMTLNRNKNVEFKDVPLLLESTSQELRPVLDSIASDLGGEHYFYSSADRLKMHVAAVFTTNFVNYLLGLAFPIVQHDHPSTAYTIHDRGRAQRIPAHPRLHSYRTGQERRHGDHPQASGSPGEHGSKGAGGDIPPFH